jgi:hypothetical protein
MTRSFRWLTLSLLAVASACGPGGPTSAQVCDKNAQVDQAAKVGDCKRIPPGNLFGEPSSCRASAEKCSAQDRTLLLDVLTCAEKLPVCSDPSKEAWVGARTGCVMRLSGVSSACNAAFAGVLPDPSGIFDAGVPDAGPQPINDGGVLSLVVVADEASFAFAWVSFQGAEAVNKWALIGISDAGVRDEPIFVTMPSRRDFILGDAGANEYRNWFVIGEGSDGLVAFGTPDSGTASERDGGAMCMGPLECPTNRVCDLGQCRVQTCQPGGLLTCPIAYQCFPDGTCNRTAFDAGMIFDAGSGTMTRPAVPLPFISNDVAAVTKPIAASPQVYLGGFPGRRPDIAAIDSARTFVALEQEGQLIGHSSVRRGRDFADDSATSSSLDTVGSRVRVAYNHESKTLYACYIVGRGVRLRRSLDEGRTWGDLAVTIEPPPLDDGGLGSAISECDIAAWRQGGAIMVTIEDNRMVTRNVTSGLDVEVAGQVAFSSSPPDAGNVYSPARASIATLPIESQVHIVFTATRTLIGGLSDTETYGVYRDGVIGTFTQPLALTYTAVPPLGNPLPQDYPTVAIDPKTKRAIAAYTSLLPGVEGLSSVQVALWNPMQRLWLTGSDLSVFTLDIDNQTKILFPGPEFQGRQIDAFSPVLASLPNGKIWLSMIVGPRLAGGGNDLRFWAVPFDFDEPTPAGRVRGWFKRPARKLSDTRAWDPRSRGVRPTVTSFSADSQISFSGAFTEGFGTAGELEGGRSIYVTIP